ncbi:histidine kinase [Mucilaginibacter sp.]|uniref:sensor histidine kinase n=2 Tax=Mucilaginibacter sp. TaxID=1882438 RepID=UPI0032675544
MAKPAIFTKMLKGRYRGLWLHIICWACYIAYEIGFVYYAQHTVGAWLNYAVFYTINIAVFYNQLVLMNGLARPHTSRLKIILRFALQFTGLLLLKWLADLWLAPGNLNTSGRLAYAQAFLPIDFFRALNFSLLAVFFWVAGNIAGYRKKADTAEKQEWLALKAKTELETRLARTRNAYLQQQLNPHMLFNSLNFIYNSVYQHSEEGARCILLLSDILRYSLENTAETGPVRLPDEIAQLENLITINRLRYGPRFYLATEFTGDFGNMKIIPLVLITLTENIFKHGDLTGEHPTARLTLRADAPDKLTFHTRNRKKAKRAAGRANPIGLQNTRVRLDYAYPDQYELVIREDENWFDLTLNISL